MTTKAPAPVDVPITVTTTGPLDQAPAPVNAATDPELPRTPVPVLRPAAVETPAPAPTPYSSSATTTPVLPIEEEPVDLTPAAETTDSNIIPTTPRYVTVLDNGTVVVSEAAQLNFSGSGVSVVAQGSTANIVITAGGSSYGNANVAAFLAAFGSNTLVTTGNVTGSYFIGNGSQLTGLPAGYANANVASYLAGSVGNIIPVGNNAQSLGNATNRWANLWLSGNTIQLGDLSLSAGASGLTSTTGFDLENSSAANIEATGNITANNFIATEWLYGGVGVDAPQLQMDDGVGNSINLGNYGGSLVYESTANVTGGFVPASDNTETIGRSDQRWATVYANAFIGDGSQLTGISTANTGNITFVNTTMSAPAGDDIVIQAINSDDDIINSELLMSPGDTWTRLEQWSSQNSSSFTTADWATGVYTIEGGLGAVQFTGATTIINFVNSLQGTGQIYFSVNGGPQLVWDGSGGGSTNITFYTPTLPGTNPTTVTSFEYYYSYKSGFEIDYDAEEVNIYANNTDINIQTNGASIELTSSGDASVIGNQSVSITNFGNTDGVYITTDATGASYQWQFDQTGNLTLPRGGVVHETNIPYGGLSGNTIALLPQGGTSDDQQLLIYPTVGADANHLHLTSGNLYNTELFLGNDDLYVKLANTGNIVINSNDNTGNTAQWTFGTAGTILNSGNLTIQTPNGVPGAVTAITGSSGSWESNPTSNLATTGGTGTGLTVNVTEDGGYASTIAIATPGTGYSNGDSISVVSGSSNASFTISVLANGWTFSTTGNLTAPGNITAGNISTGSGSITGGNVNGNVFNGNVAFGNGVIGGIGNITGGNLIASSNISTGWLNIGNIGNIAVIAANALFQITANAASNTAPYWTFNTDGTMYVPGNISGDNGGALIIDGNGLGEGIISLPATAFGGEQIAIVNKFSLGNGIRLETNGGNLFFDDTGNLTVPGNIIMPPGTALRGSGASPAPSINGFSSVSAETLSATGNITGGNISVTGNITGNTAGFAIGYRDIPQVSLASNVTTALTDAGKHYYSTSASNLSLTIANNTSVVWPVGAAISIVNRGTGNITIAGDTGVSLYLAGNATAGNRTVTTYGMATAMNVAANVWMISGTVV